MSCVGTMGVPLSGEVYVRELELHQGCQGPFRGSGGKVGFLLRHNSGKGPPLTLRGESPGFSRVVAANLGFLLNYEEDVRDPLMLPQEIPVSMRVARGLSGFLSCHSQGRDLHLFLRPEPQVSSLVLTCISDFLWSFHRGVRPRLVWRHASPFSCRAGKAVSGFLSS